jgi:hypothetical protein
MLSLSSSQVQETDPWDDHCCHYVCRTVDGGDGEKSHMQELHVLNEHLLLIIWQAFSLPSVQVPCVQLKTFHVGFVQFTNTVHKLTEAYDG